MNLTAITGATVIDGTGGPPLADAVVLVEDGRVGWVRPRAEAIVPERAEVLDATGRFVIPGLMDANVHLCGPYPDVLLQYDGRYAELIEEGAQLTLRSGVTTVFDTWGPLDALTAARDRIARGEVPGSRMYVAGNIVGFGGPLTPDFFDAGQLLGPDLTERINAQFEQGIGPDLFWLTPDGVRERVREYIERSAIDFVKYASSGHGKFRHMIALSQPMQRVVVEEAHRAGLTVQAHTTTVESLRMAVESGVDLLQHPDATGLEPIPDETLTAIVERPVSAAVIVYTDRHHAWVREHGPAWLGKYITNQTRDENQRRLIAAGARVLMTTDGLVSGPAIANHPVAGMMFTCDDSPCTIGESHFTWLEAVVQRGMTPMAALLAATRDVAVAYGRDTELGTLEPGKRADLVVLDADPLADVRNYRRIHAVLKDGVRVDRDALPARRLLTEPAA
jgi:imidazolonepropionase-like amidohydrolase